MDGYLDGELDPITNRASEQHLSDCHRCEQAYEAQRALVHTIASAAPYYKAPADLRHLIQSSLRDGIDAKTRRSVTRGSQLPVAREHGESRSVLFDTPWNWLALAAAIVLAAVILSNLVPQLRQPGADQFLATELIASHVRSLMASHLTDVASSDQHTVKPWLDTKLDFAPPVFDLTNDGFPLIGGRLDYIENRPVAALVYQRRKHFINLFIWPAESVMTAANKTISRQGYQLVQWIDGDFNYWAVSDVSDGDLQAFRQAFEKQLQRR
jgi:anti-sigma factor RsiW